MSQLPLRLFRSHQLFKQLPLLYRNAAYVPGATSAHSTSICLQTRTMTSSQPPKMDKDEIKKEKEQLDYTIKFKMYEVKKIMKDVYSLYGPLFVVCHIGVSLISLGSFCSLVWLNLDPLDYLPQIIQEKTHETVLHMTGEGGKFVIAYALHKLILPLRLVISVSITRTLGTKIKLRKKPTD